MPKVLVVDDNHAILAAVGAALGEYGIETDAAHNGKQALEKLEAQSGEVEGYKAIILDIIMPIMDGWEVLAALKENPEWQNIPVVVLTGRVNTAEDIAQITEYDGVFVGKKDSFLELLGTLVERLIPGEE